MCDRNKDMQCQRIKTTAYAGTITIVETMHGGNVEFGIVGSHDEVRLNE